MTDDDILAAIRACVTVIRPGQVLIVRIRPDMTPAQADTFMAAINETAMQTGIRIAVIACEELAVADGA